MALIRKLQDWIERPGAYPPTENPRHVLLGHPGAFRIEEVHNPLMTDAAGKPKTIDRERALAQWASMRKAFQDSGLTCLTLEPHPDLPDLCFTANPSFVVPTTADRREIWLAHMRYPARAAESELHAGFFHAAGYLLKTMPADVGRFEGHGDGLWHPGRFLLHAAVGPRSEARAWEVLQKAYPELDILLYELQDGDCYHLDTALATLNETCALIVPSAFSEQGLALLHAAFPDHIELSATQGSALLGNAFCADGETVFLPAGDADLAARIEAKGFEVVTLDLAEFHKAGGSVFCLKQAY